MDKMSRASSVLLLTLVLNVQLYSSAPIPAEGGQSSPVVEEPLPEEHTPVEKTESDEEKYIPTAAAPFPEVPPDPEPVTASEEPLPQEALTAASQEFTEETVQDAVEETSLDRNVEVPPAESEPPALLTSDEETSEDKADAKIEQMNLDGNEEVNVVDSETEEVDHVGPAEEETTAEEPAQEHPAVIVSKDSAEPESNLEEQEETIPVTSPEDTEQDAKEDDAFVPIMPEGDPASREGTPPVGTEEETSPEPAQEHPDVIVVEDLTGPESDLEEQQEVIPVTIPETTEEDPEEDAKEDDALVPIMSEGDSVTHEETPPVATEEEDSLVHSPAEPETEDKVEEEASPEPAPDEPAVSVLVEPTQGEPASEDPILIIPLEDTEHDDTEDNSEEEAEGVQSYPGEEDRAKKVPGAPRVFVANTAVGPKPQPEPAAQMNRGAILGAALATLLSFIVIGCVVMVLSKKLR